MREEAPVVLVPAVNAWLVTGYDEVRAVHADGARFVGRQAEWTLECIGEHNILGVEGEQHQRYRVGLHACLAPRVVNAYTDEIIAPVVDELLETLSGQTSAELMAEYFEPISVLALGRVIGIPEIDAATLRRWFHGIIAGDSNVAYDRAVADEANSISREIDARLREVFERIDEEETDTIISHLLRHAVGTTLQERVHDITPTLKIVLAGGLQEPGHAAGTLMYALLNDPQLRDRFQAVPGELIEQAADEAVRWVAPIQISSRQTTEEVELGGVTIPAGAFVNSSLAAANRDPKVFGDDADCFNVDRPKAKHLGFGFGSHFCSGSFFGRVVMRLAVQRLFERHPSIRIDLEARSFFYGFSFRAPRQLHARWD